LERCQALVVEHFTNLAAIEAEVGVSEVNQADTHKKDQHVGVVCLTLGLKRIVTQFVAVRQIVNISFFFKRVTACIGGEDVLVAGKD
jgi:hypothetical protein